MPVEIGEYVYIHAFQSHLGISVCFTYIGRQLFCTFAVCVRVWCSYISKHACIAATELCQVWMAGTGIHQAPMLSPTGQCISSWKLWPTLGDTCACACLVSLILYTVMAEFNSNSLLNFFYLECALCVCLGFRQMAQFHHRT